MNKEGFPDMDQHVLTSGPLLDAEGNLTESGYAFSLVKKYDRDMVKAPKSRIKEWDYYYVGNGDRGVALTIADNGYMDLAAATVFDFRADAHYVEKTHMRPFPMGSLHLPSSSSEGDSIYVADDITIRFTHEGGKRHLYCYWPHFSKKKETLRVDLYLEETTGDQSLAIATPWPKKKHFYYNQKINNLRSTGYAKLGEDFLDFNKDTYGVLDWGRGVWTYENTWYWSSLNAISEEGDTIGWNLGYGFGDTSAASENILYVNDKAFKLNDVRFDIPMSGWGGDDFLAPWTFRSKDRDIQIIFTPVLNRHSNSNLLFLQSRQNQVFGKFSGLIKIPGSGQTLAIVDLPGFAEKVYNRW
jgi:hypothetical protein